jgi:hypothetical protein
VPPAAFVGLKENTGAFNKASYRLLSEKPYLDDRPGSSPMKSGGYFQQRGMALASHVIATVAAGRFTAICSLAAAINPIPSLLQIQVQNG